MVLNCFQYNNSLAKSQDKIGGGLSGNYFLKIRICLKNVTKKKT